MLFFAHTLPRRTGGGAGGGPGAGAAEAQAARTERQHAAALARTLPVDAVREELATLLQALGPHIPGQDGDDVPAEVAAAIDAAGGAGWTHSRSSRGHRDDDRDDDEYDSDEYDSEEEYMRAAAAQEEYMRAALAGARAGGHASGGGDVEDESDEEDEGEGDDGEGEGDEGDVLMATD